MYTLSANPIHKKGRLKLFRRPLLWLPTAWGFKTARAYFLIAVRILSAMWVAPAARPDIPIRDAAASLINSFILSLFLVFVLRMLSSGRLIICRLRRCFWRRSSRWRSDRTCQSGRRLPIWLSFSWSSLFLLFPPPNLAVCGSRLCRHLMPESVESRKPLRRGWEGCLWGFGKRLKYFVCFQIIFLQRFRYCGQP